VSLGKAIKMGFAKTIDIVDEKTYTIAGVQSYGKGIVNRRTEIGVNLKMKKYQVIEENFLMWCKVDTKNGAFGITKKEHVGSLASMNMALARIDLQKYNPKFLEKLFSFEFFHSYITHLSSGTTNRKYLTPDQLCLKVEIPELTLEEQNKFIELSDKMVDLEIQKELTNQFSLVKQLRQAFLSEAMQGKLVLQLPDKSGQAGEAETGQQLLARIKAEKAQLIKDRKLKKEKQLPPIKPEEIPYQIPEDWVWCRLGEILLEIKYGTSQSCDYDANKNSKVLRIPNISGLVINNADLKYTNLSIKERSELALKKDDILIIRSNGSRELVGKTALVTEEFVDYTYAGYLIRLRYNSSLINPKYLWLVTISTFFRSQIESPLRTTVGINNINTQEISQLLLAIPSQSVQQKIVVKLDKLMENCDDLAYTIKQSQLQNEQLLQQVLKEALEVREEEIV